MALLPATALNEEVRFRTSTDAVGLAFSKSSTCARVPLSGSFMRIRLIGSSPTLNEIESQFTPNTASG